MTHPKGGKAVLVVNRDWVRGEAGVNGLTLVDVALGWKTQFEEKGWTVKRKGIHP